MFLTVSVGKVDFLINGREWRSQTGTREIFYLHFSTPYTLEVQSTSRTRVSQSPSFQTRVDLCGYGKVQIISSMVILLNSFIFSPSEVTSIAY